MKPLSTLFLGSAFPISMAIAQTSPEFEQIYNHCLEREGAGKINNSTVLICSVEAGHKAKSEIDKRYRSIYGKLLSKNPLAARKLERSQKAWLEYRNTHCDLAVEYVGSPMFAYCPYKLNSERALQLRELDKE